MTCYEYLKSVGAVIKDNRVLNPIKITSVYEEYSDYIFEENLMIENVDSEEVCKLETYRYLIIKSCDGLQFKYNKIKHLKIIDCDGIIVTDDIKFIEISNSNKVTIHGRDVRSIIATNVSNIIIHDCESVEMHNCNINYVLYKRRLRINKCTIMANDCRINKLHMDKDKIINSDFINKTINTFKAGKSVQYKNIIE